MTSLCQTCRSGLVTTRDNGWLTIHCQVSHPPMRMPTDITRCSEYEDRRTPASYEMEKIAWTLRTDQKGQVLGFTAPKKGRE